MYNEKLEDYTRSVAREMIYLDRESWADDYLDSGKAESWLSFLDDPGLVFYLITEGRVPFQAMLTDVLEDQFSRLKLDLALAHALVAKSELDPQSPEAPEIASRFSHLLSDIDIRDLALRDGVSYEAQHDQLFKIYQIRRRLRYAFRDLDPACYSHQLVREMSYLLTAQVKDVRYRGWGHGWQIFDREADAALRLWIRHLKEGTTWGGNHLRYVLYCHHLISDYHDD